MKGKNLLFSLLAVLSGMAFSVNAQQTGSSGNMSYYQKARVNQVTGEINPDDVLQARQQMEKMSSSRALNLDWIEAGPDNFGGFVSSVLVDNQDESGNTMYAGAFTGGIWKTTNGGLIWNKINADNKNIFVSSFAQTSDGTIYASTGIKDRFVGQGVYKSENGQDFVVVPSTEPNHKKSEAAWAYTQKLTVGPDENIYVATNDGLMISTNGGDSWQRAATSEEEIAGFTCDVEVGNDGYIYTFIDGEAYHSGGAADAFNLISGSADSLLPSGEARIKFAAAPSEPAKVYALVVDSDGFLEGVYLSNNNGIEWDVIGPGGSDLFNPFETMDEDVGSGLTSAAIAVAPENPEMVFIGGTFVYAGLAPGDDGYYAWEEPFLASNPLLPMGVHSFHFVNSSKFFIASEYGVSSFNGSTGEYKTYNKFLNISSFNSVSLGIDEKVLAGENKYGILRFPMVGNTEMNASLMMMGRGGLVERSVLGENNIIISFEAVQGTQEQMFRSQDMGEAYGQNFLKDAIGYSTASEYEADFIQFKLWESFDNSYSESEVYFKAADDTSYNAGDKVYVQSKTVGYPFEYTLESNLNSGDSVSVHDPIAARLFVAAEDGSNGAELWMSPEVHLFGVEPVWYQIGVFDDDEIPSAIDVSKDGNQVYVGMETGTVYRLNHVAMANDSASLMYDSPESIITNDTVFHMEERMVTSVSVDPNDNDHVIITLGNYGNDHYVYESFNATADEPVFESIQYNLPLVPVYSSMVEMNSSDRVLVGSEFGIFALEGSSWTLEGGDMGALPVTALRQQVLDSETIRVPIGELGGETVYRTYKGITNNGVIFASTYGRGLWKSRNYVSIDEMEAPEGQQEAGLLQVYPNPAHDIVNVKVGDITTDEAYLRIFDLQGRAVYEMPLDKQQSGEATIDVSFLRSGQYLVHVIEGNKKRTGKIAVR